MNTPDFTLTRNALGRLVCTLADGSEKNAAKNLSRYLAALVRTGFLIFLPFLIVDMVVANILLALGMHMMSPTTVSLPFKLLLFVMIDGFYLLSRALMLGYAP